MKKTLTLLLVLTMILPCFAVFSTPVSAAISSEGRLPFEDLSSTHWSYPYAEFCYANGYISGQGNNYTFAGDAKLTRATFVVILARVMKADVQWYTWSTFSDCAKGTWYTPSVMWASENGYVNGTGNNKFSPDGVMTREQAAVMFARIMQKMGYESMGGEAYLYDLKGASSWAVADIKFAINYGIMSSTTTSGYVFSPQSAMTRAQIAKMFTSFMMGFSGCEHSSYNNATCTVGKSCKSCGLKLSIPNGHNVPGLSCTNGGSCSTCGAYVQSDKGLHNFSSPTCTTGSTCYNCGYQRSDALGHTTKFGICTRCNAEVFANGYVRLAYYMSKKASDNGKGVYTWSDVYYGSGYTETTKITYDANKMTYKLYYKYKDSNSSYIEYTINIPKVASSYNLDFLYISSNGTQIAKGNGYLKASDGSYNINYSYNTSFTESQINEDIKGTYELMLDSFNYELEEICNTNLYYVFGA